MANGLKYQFILQLNVVLWGLTGILGHYITFPDSATAAADSWKIVFFRTAIATASLLLVTLFIRRQKDVSFKRILVFLGVGIIIAVHWFTFFLSIKVSTISVAVVCVSMMAFFTSLIEPIVNRRKVYLSEILLGLLSVAGMSVIFGFEMQYYEGIIWGLTCALLAAIFTMINAKLTQHNKTATITKYEMMGAMILSVVCLTVLDEFSGAMFVMDTNTWLYILILGLICTTAAFLIGVWVIKYVSPFTFSISLNLEPVYTILIVLLIDYLSGSNNEKMTAEFYIGAGIILFAVVANGYIKQRQLKV